jgi:hypothetical protein
MQISREGTAAIDEPPAEQGTNVLELSVEILGSFVNRIS